MSTPETETTETKAPRSWKPTPIPATCADCGAEFPSKNQMLEHRRINHPSAIQRNKLRNKLEMARQRAAGPVKRRATRANFTPIPSTCPDCGDKFPSQMQLRMHRRDEHPKWEKHKLAKAARQIERVATEPASNGNGQAHPPAQTTQTAGEVNLCPVCGCNIQAVRIALNL